MSVFWSASIAGFIDPDIIADLPADAVEITTDEYLALLGGQSAGRRIEPDSDGRPVLVDPPPLPIAEIAAQVEAEVRRQSSAARDAWRTPGKDAVYQRKLDEAAAWRAAGMPDDLTPYPHIATETGVTAPSAAELVALWEGKADAWVQASARIEAIEQSALRAIGGFVAMEDADAVNGVLSGLSWPAPL